MARDLECLGVLFQSWNYHNERSVQLAVILLLFVKEIARLPQTRLRASHISAFRDYQERNSVEAVNIAMR